MGKTTQPKTSFRCRLMRCSFTVPHGKSVPAESRASERNPRRFSHRHLAEIFECRQPRRFAEAPVLVRRGWATSTPPNRYRASEHGGTQIDAPMHFARD